MIFLDSWVWLEYVFDGDAWRDAAAAIERANAADEGGVISATVIAEVSYRVRREKDAETAREVVGAIRDFEHVEVAPVVDEIAEYAAELRHEYYRRGDCELSYADAIHLATAATIAECHTLYSGDPDFADVDEVETVIL